MTRRHSRPADRLNLHWQLQHSCYNYSLDTQASTRTLTGYVQHSAPGAHFHGVFREVWLPRTSRGQLEQGLRRQSEKLLAHRLRCGQRNPTEVFLPASRLKMRECCEQRPLDLVSFEHYEKRIDESSKLARIPWQRNLGLNPLERRISNNKCSGLLERR